MSQKRDLDFSLKGREPQSGITQISIWENSFQHLCGTESEKERLLNLRDVCVCVFTSMSKPYRNAKFRANFKPTNLDLN